MSRHGPRIILIGGTYRALCVLERLLERGERVVAFIGQEGGGERDFCPEILEMCDRASIPARSAHKLGEEIVRWLEDRIRPDMAIAVGMDLEIPVALGGNCRLGLVEIIDFFHSESCPGVTLRQRGQDVLVRELPTPGDQEEAGDAYLGMVEEMLEVVDEYLDQFVTSACKSEITIPFDPAPIVPDALPRIAERPEPGPETARLEGEVASYVGAEAVVALGATSEAFSLLMRALELREGDEVICPALISSSAVEAVRACGARPVFAEVEPDCLTLDPDRVREAVSARTRALLIAHPFGQPAALDDLYGLAQDLDLEVIEDAGASLGARFQGSRIGRSPCTCVFRMPLGPGDTGHAAVFLTLSPALAERIGACADSLRLGDGAAGIARHALATWEDILAARRRNAGIYSSELVRYDAFRVPPTPDDRPPIYASYVLGVTRFARTTAEDLYELLSSSGVDARRLALPLDERELCELPAADQVRASSLLLPVHAELGAAEIDTVLDLIFGYAIG